MFIAALFVTAKIRKQPTCPSIDEWMKKMWSMYTQWNTTQPYKKKEILPSAPTWMDGGTPGFPCPSLSPKVCSNLCPRSGWYYLIISSSGIPFTSFSQSFPASGSSPMSWLFASGGQSIGTSATVLPMNIQGWFPLGLTGLISLMSKGFVKYM